MRKSAAPGVRRCAGASGVRDGFGLVAGALAAIALSALAQSPPERVSLPEYPVYDAALALSLGTAREALVIIDTTVPRPIYGDGDAERVARVTKDLGIPPGCAGAYRDANREAVEVENGFDLPVTHWLMSAGRFERFFGDEPEFGWKRFFDRHPDTLGIVRLSRVGFCEDRTRALVYVEHGCGPECGSGRFLSLERAGRGWLVAGVLREWYRTDTHWPEREE